MTNSKTLTCKGLQSSSVTHTLGGEKKKKITRLFYCCHFSRASFLSMSGKFSSRGKRSLSSPLPTLGQGETVAMVISMVITHPWSPHPQQDQSVAVRPGMQLSTPKPTKGVNIQVF